jgi:hypothetical protein
VAVAVVVDTPVVLETKKVAALAVAALLLLSIRMPTPLALVLV